MNEKQYRKEAIIDKPKKSPFEKSSQNVKSLHVSGPEDTGLLLKTQKLRLKATY